MEIEVTLRNWEQLWQQERNRLPPWITSVCLFPSFSGFRVIITEVDIFAHELWSLHLFFLKSIFLFALSHEGLNSGNAYASPAPLWTGDKADLWEQTTLFCLLGILLFLRSYIQGLIFTVMAWFGGLCILWAVWRGHVFSCLNNWINEPWSLKRWKFTWCPVHPWIKWSGPI